MTSAQEPIIRDLEDFAGIASDWFWESDARHRFTYFSQRMEDVTNIAADKLLGTRRDRVPGVAVSGVNWAAHLEDLKAFRPFRGFEYAIDRPTDGSRLWLRVAGQPQFSPSGAFIGYRGTGHDITHEKFAMEKLVAANATLADRNHQLQIARAALERAAYHDALTGVLNRRAFERDLKAALALPHTQIGLLHIDLDRFKLVNDSLGHQIGDAVLVEASRRIKGVACGDGTVYRIGGDEFLMLLSSDVSKDRCAWIADTIVELMDAPMRFSGLTARVGLSVGVAIGTSLKTQMKDLVGNADAALYEAKRRGRNRVRHITPALEAQMHVHRLAAADLPRAIDADEFVPFFQPQVNVVTGQVVGVEALARWDHPTRGLLTPDTFLAAITELGLSTIMDRCIMRKALAESARLRRLGLHLPAISVNISAARLMDTQLIADIEEFWQDRNCQLCIELLETIYYDEVRENSVIHENLARLRTLGVRVETDDFGSGRASIMGLLTVRPDRLKIDRTLIAGAVQETAQRNVVSAILNMARALGIESMAEGVEDYDAIRTIHALGCDVFQGYALAKPMPATDLATYLTNGVDTQLFRKSAMGA